LTCALRSRGPERASAQGRDRLISEKALVILECKEAFDNMKLSPFNDQAGRRDPVKDDLVKLRHFARLTLVRAAAAHGLSPCTADRSWVYTRA
jgi:hypothetical protein